MDEAEEVLGIVLPAHQDTTLPLYAGKEALYDRLYNVAKKRFWSTAVGPVVHRATEPGRSPRCGYHQFRFGALRCE